MTKNRPLYEEALNRGYSYNWDAKYQEAIKEFEIAVREAPEEPAAYDGLGTAYENLGNLQKALENYKQAARYSRGEVMYLAHVAKAQESLKLFSDAGKTYLAIGEAELNRRRLKDAMDNWNRAVQLEPNLLRAHQRLASIYQRDGAVRSAIREYLAIARILQEQNEKEKALQSCQMALQLDPRNPEVLTAIEHLRQGKKLFEGEEIPSAPQGGGLRLLQRSVLGENADKQTSEAAAPVQDTSRRAMEKLAVGLFSDEETDERDLLIAQALDYQRRGMVNEALSAYERAVAAGVNNTAVRFNLGLLYQDKLRFEDAIKEFEISVKDPEYRLGSYFALGESYRARGRIDKALENFINALKIVDLATVQHDQADRLIELYENLADSLVTQGERDKATAFANALVDFLSHKGWEDKVKEARSRLDTISEAGTMILGDVLTAGSEQVLESLYLSQEYTKRGMYNTAIEETYRAIQLSPDYLPAHIQLAEVLAKQGRSEVAALKFNTVADTFRVRNDVNGAILTYEKVLELTPLDLATRARLIDLFKRHGQIDKALEHYIAMGQAYYQLAQVDKARETYQEALKLSPRGSSEHNWRGKLLRAMADIDMQRLDWRRALPAYKELRQIDSEDEWTAITLVDLYYKVEQPVNAIRELDQYLVHLVRGGRSGKVIGILEDMVAQHPTDTHLIDRLSRLYLQQKRQADAIDLLDKLGEAQLEAGETAGAVETIQKILKLNPPNATGYHQLLNQLRQK